MLIPPIRALAARGGRRGAEPPRGVPLNFGRPRASAPRLGRCDGGPPRARVWSRSRCSRRPPAQKRRRRRSARSEGDAGDDPADGHRRSYLSRRPGGRAPDARRLRPYAFPAGYGVITQWSHSSGDRGGALALTVWATSPATYLRWRNETRAVRPTRCTASPPGSRCARATGWAWGRRTGDLPLAVYTARSTRTTRWPSWSTTAAATRRPGDKTRNGHCSDVSARVETDADGDGYGDDTQDRCPTRADLQTACPLDPAGALGKPSPLPGQGEAQGRQAEVLVAGVPGGGLGRGVRGGRQDGAGRHARDVHRVGGQAR